MVVVKHMRNLTFSALLMLSLICISPGFAANTNQTALTKTTITNLVDVPLMTMTNLLAHKDQFKGKKVEVRGYYVGEFEHYALYGSETNRDYMNSLWIDPFRNHPEYKHNIDRGEFRGHVRIIGTFDYRPRFGSGHLGGWPAQITNLELFEKIK